MPSASAKSGWGRALGVYLAEGHLTLTEVVTTLVGRKVEPACRVPIGEGGPGKALGEWLASRLTPRQRRHLSVCVGLAAEQTFFTTRTFDQGSEEAPTAARLLAGSGGSLDAANAAADYVRCKLHHATVYSVAACRRSLAEELSQALKEAGVEKARLEPAPNALLEVADRSAKPPRAWKVFVRVLMGKDGGLSILVINGRPMLWRRFALTKNQEAVSIASAVRHLEVHALGNLGIRGVSGIFVQGNMEDSLADRLRQEVAAEVMAAPGPEKDAAAYSLALALSARKKQSDRIDLFKAIRPPPTLSEMFSRKLAVGMAMAAAAMALVMWYTLTNLEGEHQGVCTQNASYKWAHSVRTDVINGERKSLSDEVSAVQQFLGTRAIWSNYLRDLPTRLPSNSCLQSLNGQYELKSTGKNSTQRVNRSLVMCGMVRFSDRGGAPKEIDAFLESLRGAELLKRTFPIVNLAEIKWRKDAAADIALFTIIATPVEKAPKSKDEEKTSPDAEKAPAHG
jgi:hypothetical protein